MTKKQKVVLKRGARSLAAIVVAAVAGWVAGPEALDVLGQQGQAIAVAVGVPALLMLDKYLRYGADGGE